MLVWKFSYLFIQEPAPSVSSLSFFNLTIYFKNMISTGKKPLLVSCPMIFMFVFSTHVNFSLPFSQVSWSSPLHPFWLVYAKYYECAEALVPWVLSNNCIKNLKTQSFFYFVRKLYSGKWHFIDEQIPSATITNHVQSWDWIQDPASLLARNTTFANKIYVSCCKL